MKARIVGAIVFAMLGVGSLPFIGAATKIERLSWLAIPLVVLAGSAGLTMYTKRVEAVLGGVVLAALLPVLLNNI